MIRSDAYTTGNAVANASQGQALVGPGIHPCGPISIAASITDVVGIALDRTAGQCHIEAVSMTQCVCIVICIAVTTGDTGMDCVAAFGAGGGGDYRFVAVAQYRHFPGFGKAAAGTGSLLLALFGAGRSLGLCPGTHIMA